MKTPEIKGNQKLNKNLSLVKKDSLQYPDEPEVGCSERQRPYRKHLQQTQQNRKIERPKKYWVWLNEKIKECRANKIQRLTKENSGREPKGQREMAW